RLMALAEEVGDLQRGLKESEQIVARLENAMQSSGRVGIYSDLRAARLSSTEILNQTLDLRRRFQTDARNLASGYLAPQDRAALEQIAGERGILDVELKNLPLTAEGLKDQAFAVRAQFTALDGRASEINVIIQD